MYFQNNDDIFNKMYVDIFIWFVKFVTHDFEMREDLVLKFFRTFFP